MFENFIVKSCIAQFTHALCVLIVLKWRNELDQVNLP